MSRPIPLLVAGFLTLGSLTRAADSTSPIVAADLVVAEQNGVVAVEAEHFYQQTKTDQRAFHLVTEASTPRVTPDGDPPHVAGASGGAYLEILPDTRRSHADKLTAGENFSDKPGQLAVLSYKVHIANPGRYYVWARAFSSGSEDNGLHVGLDGEWPESGQRLQWCEGKRQWWWESKQRTPQEHCGEPYKIYLDIKQPGEHTIHFSLREDGFEFDKWMMTRDREMARPDGVGPDSVAHAGQLPQAFPFVAEKKAYPPHWGQPPATQTRDLRPLPGGYGMGSSTLAGWIQKNLDADAQREPQRADGGLTMPARMFADADKQGYYFDRERWLAVNPERHQRGEASRTFPFPEGTYDITIEAVGESDGRSRYEVGIASESLPPFEAPLATEMFAEGPQYHHTWQGVKITENAVIRVASQIGSEDGAEHSRARWAALRFTPADDATRAAATTYLAQNPAPAATPQPAAAEGSPTTPVSTAPLHEPRQADGTGAVEISGEHQQWHAVTLTIDGPFAHEQDNQPNPFTDYRLAVTWTHSDGTNYTVPGYFAADGDAANSSAEQGTKWRAHFAPDRTGEWSYKVSFVKGALVALDPAAAGEPVAGSDGQSGKLTIAKSDKQGRDLRAHGRLTYVGERYLRFAGTDQYFLKVGADSPETLLAFADFDNTEARAPQRSALKHYAKHVSDWREGDPTWGSGKGKGLIGAINYLSGKGCNSFSFLPYNAGGDGDNVWPFIHRDDKLHYDCSKLDQWGMVFAHGTAQGMYLHFKLQETEIDDHRKGENGAARVPESLDGGDLGVQRKLYCRELIARFAHNLALNWNLGEENTQSPEQQVAMANYIAALDAYDHHLVVHTFPEQQEKVYRQLLGDKSPLTGASLQNNNIQFAHARTKLWVDESAKAGKPWVVAVDESGAAAHAIAPDLGYEGFDGHDKQGKMVYTQHECRKQVLWGTLMAGGAGCEHYFGYQFPQNDLVCEDWRSRDQTWDYGRIAINFFHEQQIPFWQMENHDELVGGQPGKNDRYCFAKSDDTYLVYLANGGTTSLDLRSATGEYRVEWFNPRAGGELAKSTVTTVTGGSEAQLGTPPADPQEDWLIVVRRNSSQE